MIKLSKKKLDELNWILSQNTYQTDKEISLTLTRPLIVTIG